MGRAYRKFGSSLPEVAAATRLNRVRSLNGTTHKGEAIQGSPAVSKIAALEQEADTQFLSPITIGGQSVNLDFDTGSSDMYVH